MRSGNWRGVSIAFGSTCALALVIGLTANSAKADGFATTIPSLVPAVDLSTGQPYMAPPVPYGHYVGSNLDTKIAGALHGMGAGAGHGLLGGGCGIPGCTTCGGVAKTGFCLPSFGHKSLALPGCGIPKITPSSQCLPSKQCAMPSKQCVTPSKQCVKPSGQCALPACGLGGKHGLPGCCMLGGIPCVGCGGAGCGLCGGSGHGAGAGLLGGLLHSNKIKWFVGPGGPVPLTPGYTPYVVTTRSPRDFLSFPPYSPDR